MQTIDTSRGQRSRIVGRLAWAALVTVPVVGVVASAWVDRATVEDRQDLTAVDFGLPWAWLHQDQTALDPPFPYQTAVLSPWEYPTTVTWLVFVANVVVITAVLAVLGFLGVALARHALSRPTP